MESFSEAEKPSLAISQKKKSITFVPRRAAEQDWYYNIVTETNLRLWLRQKYSPCSKCPMSRDNLPKQVVIFRNADSV